MPGSLDVPDEARLRRVYAEIARLKRDIDRKKRNLSHSGRAAYPAKSERTHSERRFRPPSALPSAISESRAQSESHHEAQHGYIIDHQRRTLMTPRAKRQVQEMLQKRRAQHAARSAQLRAEHEHQQWAELTHKNASEADAYDRIMIEQDVFGLKPDGTKLLPISGHRRTEGSLVTWHAWSYLACKSGLLRRTFGDPAREHCRYFTRTGACSRGTRCLFVHDMAHMALCRHFLAGRCVGHCLLSHERSEFNTPICRYHFQDRCSNSGCKFSHALPPRSHDKSVSIWTCRPFSVGGWCDRGALCPFAHLYNCPDYEEQGQCPRGQACSLTHTATRRVQRMIAEPTEIDNVLIAQPEPDMEARTVVSSYTVDPAVLFVHSGQVDFSVDRADKMIIDLGSSDEDGDFTREGVEGLRNGDSAQGHLTHDCPAHEDLGHEYITQEDLNSGDITHDDLT